MQGQKDEKLSNKHFSYPSHYYTNDIFGVTKRSETSERWSLLAPFPGQDW